MRVGVHSTPRRRSLLSYISMALTLVLNGQNLSLTLADPATLDAIVLDLGLKADRVAIEHNGQIVARAVWNQTEVRSGDRLEVVQFVGGGAPVRR